MNQPDDPLVPADTSPHVSAIEVTGQSITQQGISIESGPRGEIQLQGSIQVTGIVVSRDQAELCLRDHIPRVLPSEERDVNWEAIGVVTGFLLAIVLAFAAATFHAPWDSVFRYLGVICGGLLAYFLWPLRHHLRGDTKRRPEPMYVVIRDILHELGSTDPRDQQP